MAASGGRWDSRAGGCLTHGAATEMEVAVTAFAPLLGLLEDVPDHRRAEGKVYRLPHVLLFSILAIVSGGNSYRSIATFIDTHRRRLNRAFGVARQQSWPVVLPHPKMLPAELTLPHRDNPGAAHAPAPISVAAFSPPSTGSAPNTRLCAIARRQPFTRRCSVRN